MNIAEGDKLPERQHTPTEVQLMLYNAALWNGHRIHFDEPYTKNVEGYPALVLAGPLLGDWLNQIVEEWIGDAGALVRIEYSNRVAGYVGDTLTSGGTVTRVDGEYVDVDVFVRNEAGEVLAPGVARVRLNS